MQYVIGTVYLSLVAYRQACFGPKEKTRLLLESVFSLPCCRQEDKVLVWRRKEGWMQRRFPFWVIRLRKENQWLQMFGAQGTEDACQLHFSVDLVSFEVNSGVKIACAGGIFVTLLGLWVRCDFRASVSNESCSCQSPVCCENTWILLSVCSGCWKAVMSAASLPLFS